MKSNQKCASITKYLETDAKNLSSLWGALIAEELIRLGVTMVCIAPGSRSTPLVAACAQRKELTKVVCQDERSAGFFALGHARATKTPAVVIVTSGSAVANLWPSVVEASNDRVPLILLTADRPPELRDVGSNQTIDQVKIFGNYVRWSTDMPVPDPKIPLRFLLSSVDEAVRKSLYPKPGPVHLNCMFREPFVPDFSEAWDSQLLIPLRGWMVSDQPLTTHLGGSRASSEEALAQVAQLVERAHAPVIVAGTINDAEAQTAVLRFAEQTGIPVLPDVLSGLRFLKSPQIAHHVDLALVDEKLKSHRSDLVIQVGGRLVSKRLQQYLDSHDARGFVMIDEHDDRNDPSCLVTHRVDAKIAPFFEGLGRVVGARQPRSNCWLEASALVERELDVQKPALSEVTVATSLLAALNDDNFLFVSSSMPIRDLNMFGKAHASPPQIFANRGASGIDGIVSTACGVAKASAQRGVLFCGDLTFLHDTNGLSLLKSLDNPFVIVVVNNQGGGIFTMLDIQRQKDIFSPYFDAEHATDLSGLCMAYAIKHQRVETLGGWDETLKEIVVTKTHLVVEVISDKWRNRDEHDRLREAVRARLSL